MPEDKRVPTHEEFMQSVRNNWEEIQKVAAQEQAKQDAKNSHDLVDFMKQVSVEISSEYNRIQKRATEDPGTAGDQGEENWAEILRDWLPRSFEVVTKGRIISQDGRTSAQVDVLVLDDAYPKKLLNKKLYLAAGVAAAFECKTTLKASHIGEAVENCAQIKSFFPLQYGTPYRELHSPIVYGLLAHSHSWKGAESSPESNISSKLDKADRSYVNHPRFQMDVLCVADLGTWSPSTFVSFQRPQHSYQSIVPADPGREATPTTSYSALICKAADLPKHITAIGVLISVLSQRLAWEKPILRSLSQYYRIANSGQATHSGTPMRMWPSAIYSGQTRFHVEAGLKQFTSPWDEWAFHF